MNRMREWFLGRCTSVPRVGSTFVFLAALLPAAVAGVQATRVAAGFAQDDGANETMRARRRLLNAVPRDPAVLINVPFRDMPSSPELVNLATTRLSLIEPSASWRSFARSCRIAPVTAAVTCARRRLTRCGCTVT